MNYFAHGNRFLNDPYFLVGTAIPDWLSAMNRGIRIRDKHVEPFLNDKRTIVAQLAAGIRQHHTDDDWFHRSHFFFQTSGEVSQLFLQSLGDQEGFYPHFLGHITTELLLDAILIEQQPDRLERYYQVLSQLNPQMIQWAVNQIAIQKTDRLAWLISFFCQEQFLRDYTNPARLLIRLNQILARVKRKLRPLPLQTEDLLLASREIVQKNLKLLPLKVSL